MESQALTDVLTRVNASAAALGPLVTGAATVINGLKGQVAVSMSPDEQAAVVTGLQTVAEALDAAGVALTTLQAPPA